MSSMVSPDSSSSSSSSTNDSDDYDEEYRLAQQEWVESLEQLQTLVSVLLLPFLGKWLGRKWSHWGEQYPLWYLLHTDSTRTRQHMLGTWPSD